MSTSIPKILTPRLCLRALNVSDVEDIFDTYSDKNAMKFRGNPPLATWEEAQQMIQKAIADYAYGRSIRWGIELLNQNKLIGTFLWTTQKGQHQIGYSIHKNWWRKGVATEVLTAMSEHLFTERGIDQLTANVHPDNLGSIKLLEKCGFKLGTRTKDLLTFYKLST
ncbi:MAG: GNAT family N-acetyltransferase [Bacteroidota bacterium]